MGTQTVLRLFSSLFHSAGMQVRSHSQRKRQTPDLAINSGKEDALAPHVVADRQVVFHMQKLRAKEDVAEQNSMP